MCADPFYLTETIRTLEAEKVEWLHIDVMDGHYVPNMALSPDFCAFLARRTRIPLDIHLMVENPGRFVEFFARFPNSRISFHPETARQPVRVIQRIRELGCSPGIALDPGVPVAHCSRLHPLVDQVIIMTVNPGYAGQKMLPFCVEKIAECRAGLESCGSRAQIEVDGNVSWENIPKMAAAGAGMFVAGTSSLFREGRVTAAGVKKMRRLLSAS